MSFITQTIRPDVQAMHAYPVPATQFRLKLDAMENPTGLPLENRQAMMQHLAELALNRYPSPTDAALEALLRQRMHIPDAAGIMCGNGSDELIDIIIRATCMPGDVVLSPVPTFVMYAAYAHIAHAQFVGVPLSAQFELNMPAMLAAIEAHQPKVVFLAYPNNPTGNAFAMSDVVRIIEAAPGLVVVDEAYQAFASQTFMQQVLAYPNVLVLRTVSKLGLAGVRFGYAVAAHAWVQQLDKVRSPYNVNVLTRAVVAWALQHHQVLQTQAENIVHERARMASALAQLPVGQANALPITVFPSEANFLLVRVPNATAIFEHLKTQGILIKCLHGAHPLLQDCLRITISTAAENDELLQGLRIALQQTA